jgi:bifunctional ADP-heptose synthase (sugar kinase/adenylyltransferase)
VAALRLIRPKPLPRRMLARPLLLARAMTTMSSPPHPLMIVAGTFDLLHAGHHILFHTAFAFGEKVEIWVSGGGPV